MGFAPRSQVTGLSTLLLKLAMRLSIAAYNNDFSDFGGELLYQNTTNDFEAPVFYVYRLDGNLWVLTRGSVHALDFITCAEFNETTNALGTFHLGIWQSVEGMLPQIRPFVAAHDGPIYFSGHSLGGTTGPVLLIRFLQEFPNKDFNALSFAPFPMMDHETGLRYREKIVAIVNEIDVVPTLSVPNLYNTLSALMPFIDSLPEEAIVDFLLDILETLKYFISDELYESLKEVIPAVADAVFGYGHGEQRLIRFLPGHAYQLFANNPRKIDDCEVDPETLDYLQLSVEGFIDHKRENYLSVVEALPEDQKFAYSLWDRRRALH
jgi:hypothetical protein